MVVFNDFSTYYSYNLVKSYWTPPTIQKRETLKEELIHKEFNYAFTPVSEFNEENSAISPPVTFNNMGKEFAKEVGEELLKDAIGAGFIALGTWLANPVGPEDVFFGSPLNPLDEIVGIGLIWTGRIIAIS